MRIWPPLSICLALGRVLSLNSYQIEFDESIDLIDRYLQVFFYLDNSFLRILNCRSVRVRDRRSLWINSDICKSRSGSDSGGNYAVSLSQYRLFISEFLKN